MDELRSFLERHRRPLMKQLKGVTADTRIGPDAIAFVDQVLTDWESVSEESRRSDHRPGEKVFWFTLYQLEELADIPDATFAMPYRRMMQEQLPRMRRLLAKRAPLPPEFDCCRPGAMELDMEELRAEMDAMDLDSDCQSVEQS